MTDKPKRCEFCRFLGAEDMTCHRGSPRYATRYEDKLWAEWPRVSKMDWCGDFEPWPEVEAKEEKPCQ